MRPARLVHSGLARVHKHHGLSRGHRATSGTKGAGGNKEDLNWFQTKLVEIKADLETAPRELSDIKNWIWNSLDPHGE